MTSRALYVGLGAAYIAASALSPLVLKTTPSDLDFYFWPSAETVVAGHPLLIYAGQLHDGNANDNGPIGLIPLVPMVALANALGWAGSLAGRAALTGAAVSLFTLLLAYQLVRFTAVAHGGVRQPLAVASTVLLAPALWIAVLDYGHVEQPVELCLVMFATTCALRNRNALAGVALGAAVLTRTIAGFCLVPFVLAPLATRRARAAATTALAAVIAVGVGLAPFVITDEQAVAHSLLTYRNGLPIDGGSFWIVARDASWAGFVKGGDVYLGGAVAVALVAITVRRRPTVATTHAGMMGLLTVASCCLPLLAKTVFPYYLLEPYVFAVGWWLARPASAHNWRAVVPLLLTIDVFIVKASTLGAWDAVLGVASSLTVAVAMALVSFDLLREPESAAMARHVQEGRRPRRLPAAQDAK